MFELIKTKVLWNIWSSSTFRSSPSKQGLFQMYEMKFTWENLWATRQSRTPNTRSGQPLPPRRACSAAPSSPSRLETSGIYPRLRDPPLTAGATASGSKNRSVLVIWCYFLNCKTSLLLNKRWQIETCQFKPIWNQRRFGQHP